jgi:hypothetical protein
MGGWRRARQVDFLMPLLVATILVMAAAGCNDAPSSSTSTAFSTQGLAAASATPETFRNLGKRAESAF